MPTPRLPREMLWRDMPTLADMLAAEPACKALMQVCLDHGVYYSDTAKLELLNEAFYQSTRAVREGSDGSVLKAYSRDIKANVGSSLRERKVKVLMTYILLMQRDVTPEARSLAQALRDSVLHNQPRLMHELAPVETMIRRERMVWGEFYTDLRPRPCTAEVVAAHAPDWERLTQGFSRAAVVRILGLWEDERERARVLQLIERAWRGCAMPLFDSQKVADEVDAAFFTELRDRLGVDGHYAERPSLAVETQERLERLEREAAAQAARIAELESENERLRAELNARKPRRAQERAFTLSMIVDYCKKKPGYEFVDGIVAMLYRFLRDGTDKEQELVDGIEQHFCALRTGTTHVEHQTVISAVENYQPEIQTQQVALPPTGGGAAVPSSHMHT